MSKNFNEKKYLIIIGTIFAMGFFFLPLVTQAAVSVYFDLTEPIIYASNIFIVKLNISSPDRSINVIDGTIRYDNSNLEIREVSTGDSLFVLWPKPPAFSNDKGTLSFVGGVPGGLQSKEGMVLKIIFLAKSEGETQIDFLDGFSVFLNDGQGTHINPLLKPLSLNISRRPSEIPANDEWQILLESDKNPPEPFEILVGKNPSIFNNRYFISFFAIDKESGIAHYEIQEGTESYIVGDSPYLLKNQKLRSAIRVKAIDKASNERIAELPPASSFYKTSVFWIIIVSFLAAIIIFFRKIVNRIKKKKIKNE
jgi:hypothetical protein